MKLGIEAAALLLLTTSLPPVGVIYGSKKGLVQAGSQLWHQDSPGVDGVAEGGDEFGFALFSADLDYDGIDDLAVGIPGERTQKIQSGGVDILFGTPAGLSSTDDLLVTQAHEFLFEELEDGDRFGASLGGSTLFGFTSLLIGAPGDSVNGVPNVGLVEEIGIAPDHTIGSTFLPFFVWTPHQGDGIGTAVASGDYNGDGWGDMTVGGPFIDHVEQDAGRVIVSYPTLFQQIWQQGN